MNEKKYFRQVSSFRGVGAYQHAPTPPSPDLCEDSALRDDAARAALARARNTAREAGLRPGMLPRKRRRRNSEPLTSSAGPDRRDPQLLGDELGRLIETRGWRKDVSAASVMGSWPAVAGLDIARHSAPVSFEEGILVVRAESTAWATQLTYMIPQLQARIDDAIGNGVVTNIRVTGPSAPSWKRGPRRSRGPGPRDTYG
ncbi:DUF721 domain-containing protein [Dermatophilus congolensis]|nr:DUF721 domain-containing protein [Dermatophilus congolensis]MBO3152868.1 DUF721 domain-containing protein [Dermatophilus congolensis]MBO3160122.1 DUF721 domain-containing protein [Dermatophilus congolensis]MBO3164153.1 DUF721 domain-containing protein [Dermatophilus congolensis]MBO3177699.1 DUF721 domain-containing protein [Dermatophilus congolensis]